MGRLFVAPDSDRFVTRFAHLRRSDFCIAGRSGAKRVPGMEGVKKSPEAILARRRKPRDAPAAKKVLGRLLGTLEFAAVASGLMWIAIKSIRAKVFPGIEWRGLTINRCKSPIAFWAVTLGFFLLAALIAADIFNLWNQ